MIGLVEKPIDQRQVLESVLSPRAGAVVTFDGVVRNHARGKRVTHLFYQAYKEMALKELQQIGENVQHRFPVEAISIVHRLGRLEIGESSVFIAVSSAHRATAFEACCYAIDTLKETVPIWKKEHYEDGEVWIDRADST